MPIGTMLALAITFNEGDIKYECNRVPYAHAFRSVLPPDGYRLHIGGPFDSTLAQVTDDGPLQALYGSHAAEISCVAHLTPDNCPNLAQARDAARELSQVMVHGPPLPIPPRGSAAIMDAAGGVFSSPKSGGGRESYRYDESFHSIQPNHPRYQLAHQFIRTLITCTKSMRRAHTRTYRHFKAIPRD